STAPGQPGAGGGFATLDKYLTANQSQAQPLANKLTQGVSQQYSNLSGQNASTLGNIGQQVANSPGYTAPNQGALAAEAANPVSFASDQGNVKQFQGLLTNAYGGPASAEATPEYTKQQNAINTAITQGKQQTSTEAGRNQLLEQNEAAPSAAVTGLNSAILSQSPTALGQVESAYKPFESLMPSLQAGAADINKTIGQEQAGAKESSAAANKQIADQVNALNPGLTTTANQNAAAQNKYNQDTQNFQNQWTPVSANINSVNDLMAKFGWTNSPIANTLSSNFNKPASNVTYTPTGVATADQAAQGQAFQNLIGGLNTTLPAPIATQAGTQIAPPTFAVPNA